MMSDSVRFIFRCIIKVPIFIMISYFIANIFFFSLFYFKFLGVSYAVMQTALENNYLPETEKKALEASLNSIYKYSDGTTSKVIPSASIYINTDGNDNGTIKNEREQYGNQVVVGIKYTYRWIWPLTPEEYDQKPANLDSIASSDKGVVTSTGNEDRNVNGKSELGDSVLEGKRQAKADKSTHEIKILYKVPGLQYYSDKK